MTSKQIVAGIDSSVAAEQAVDWAGAEAERRSLKLVIAHATDPVDGAALSAATVQTVLTESNAYGAELLDRTRNRVLARHPGVLVETVLGQMRPADLLVELGRSAELVVVGTHGTGRVAGTLFGSVSQRVAAHASCPVVVVGAHGPTAPGPRRVVTGVSDSPGGRAALRFAFREAAERGATLVAIRGQGGFGRSALADRGSPASGRREQETALLERTLGEVRTEFPDVPVDARLVDGPADEALPRFAQGADLLVVGCHHADDHWPSRLGNLASVVLHRGPCPVAVVGVPVVGVPVVGVPVVGVPVAVAP